MARLREDCFLLFKWTFLYKVVLIANYFECYQEGAQLRKVTMIPGDGIGPEISQSVKEIFEAAGVCLFYPLFVL